MFITFEGLDFSGKSTQVKLLADYLVRNNKKVNLIREPGGTIISEKIRDILLDKKNTGMFEESELLLFASSRAQLVRETIIPKLKENEYVISDRFHDSSFAYQGFGRGIPTNFIKSLMEFVIASAVPDITIFIDIPLEEVAKRKAAISNLTLDRIENTQGDFYKKVREGYLYLAETEDRFILLDGTKSISDLHNKIIKIIAEKEKLISEKQNAQIL